MLAVIFFQSSRLLELPLSVQGEQNFSVTPSQVGSGHLGPVIAVKLLSKVTSIFFNVLPNAHEYRVAGGGKSLRNSIRIAGEIHVEGARELAEGLCLWWSIFDCVRGCTIEKLSEGSCRENPRISVRVSIAWVPSYQNTRDSFLCVTGINRVFSTKRVDVSVDG